MTPEARYAAAATVLEDARGGRPVEQLLTNWARRSRYAGSGDRAAVRDIVFDVIRRKRSVACLGGGTTGRALILGLLRDKGVATESVFTGGRFALAPLTDAERQGGSAPEGNEARDVPDWMAEELSRSLGAEFDRVCAAFRNRAEVFLRWHEGRTTAGQAIDLLAKDGIEAIPHGMAPSALRVVSGARRVRTSAAYRQGLVELQDVSSQAVCAALPVDPSSRVLDYCAGGGGKALALAARGATVEAHDADDARMADLPARAERAGTAIARVSQGVLSARGLYDLVLVDAPCSGSGTWRRQPEAKWTLTPERLDSLEALQAGILAEASGLVAPGGELAYATCSLLDRENGQQVLRFLRATAGHWRVLEERRLSPLEGGDGFFLARMQRNTQP